MSIIKWFEISCNYCACAEQFRGDTQKDANRQAKDLGWIIEGRKHYCDEVCKHEFKTRKIEL